MNINNLIAVNGKTEGILGKLVYYSIADVLIDKETFCDIGRGFGLAKIKPSRESAADAFRNATTAIYDRLVVKRVGHTAIHRIYCRDNKRGDADRVCRELVKETLGADTNEYTKLANIYLDKTSEKAGYDNVVYDADADTYAYCERALELFDLYRKCYGRSHVDSVIESLLSQMEATKISVHGKLYFVPKQFLYLVDLLEDYIAELNRNNRNDAEIIVNSIYVVDDEKQRAKMTQEFYAGFRKDIEYYQERIQHFIDSKCRSTAVIDRWRLKIRKLEEKKQTYETILQKQLDELDGDFSVLKLQSQELIVQGQQLKLCA